MTFRDSISAARIDGPVRQPDSTWTFQFRFVPEDPTFAGHFPGRPILPGAYHLEMARAAAQWALGAQLGVREIVKAKFLRPILPGEVVRLDLKMSGEGDSVEAQARFSVLGQRAGETVMRLWRKQ
jgi:3-hydroxymyristoyl/3-hydroxydecanoyl-(acyl carrier protein) dehydratase